MGLTGGEPPVPEPGGAAGPLPGAGAGAHGLQPPGLTGPGMETPGRTGAAGRAGYSRAGTEVQQVPCSDHPEVGWVGAHTRTHSLTTLN